MWLWAEGEDLITVTERWPLPVCISTHSYVDCPLFVVGKKEGRAHLFLFALYPLMPTSGPK